MELARVRAVTEELLQQGANIADDEGDYYRLIQAMQDLGEEAKEWCRQLCQQSAKYEEKDFEYKWRWASNNGRRTIRIATFYHMARQAGVDLAAIARTYPSPEFSSNPQFPHRAEENRQERGDSAENNNIYIDNQQINSQTANPSTPGLTATPQGEETAEMRKPFRRTFSQLLVLTSFTSLLRHILAKCKTAAECDIALLSALDLLALAMPNVYGIYHGSASTRPSTSSSSDCRVSLTRASSRTTSNCSWPSRKPSSP